VRRIPVTVDANRLRLHKLQGLKMRNLLCALGQNIGATGEVLKGTQTESFSVCASDSGAQMIAQRSKRHE